MSVMGGELRAEMRALGEGLRAEMTAADGSLRSAIERLAKEAVATRVDLREIKDAMPTKSDLDRIFSTLDFIRGFRPLESRP